MRIAIVNASFGCSIKESREKYIETIEHAIIKNYKDIDCFRVFTSEIVRKKIMREENIDIDNMKTCLKRLKENEYTHVFISPTHIIPGFEYEKLLCAVEEYKNDFKEVKIARTFLDDKMGEREIDVVKSYIKTNLQNDEVVILVGHGSDHISHKYYKEFEALLREDVNNVYIVNIEGKPFIGDIVDELKRKNYRKAYLYPFLLVAGDHALNDIASDDEDSIKTFLQKNGFEVDAFITGLGANKKAIDLFVDRLK